MLIREALPLATSRLKKPNGFAAFTSRLADIGESLTGLMRDPLHVQLPRNDGRMNAALTALLAIMLYVAALALLANHVLGHVAGGLDNSLQGRVTYEILPDTTAPDNNAPDNNTHARKSLDKRAADLLITLRSMKGIKNAEILDARKMNALLAPWLGDNTDITSLPLPVLIDVQLNENAPPSDADLQALAQDGSGITLDNNAKFQDELFRFVMALRHTGFAVLGLVFFALLLTSYFAAQASFHMNRKIIGLLHLVGAEDQAVAQHVGLSVVRLTLLASCIALGLAFLTLLAVWLQGEAMHLSFFPGFSMKAMDWLVLVVSWLGLMFSAVLLCLFSVRFTVLRALRKLF